MHFVLAGAKRDKIIPSSKTLSLGDALTEVEAELTIGEKYNEKLDAVQVDGNFYLPFSLRNWNAKRAGKKHKIPVLYNADGHHPKDIGKTYNTFNSESLDYSSEKAFRDSINCEARQGNFTTRFSPIPPYRIFHHALMMGIYMIKGLYKKVFKK